MFESVILNAMQKKLKDVKTNRICNLCPGWQHLLIEVEKINRLSIAFLRRQYWLLAGTEEAN